jgi:chemotaxis signal transduction protein
VLEVVAIHGTAPVPGAPSFLAGMLGHRGAVVPLIDGAERLSGQRSPAGRARLAILVATSFGTVGIAVDRVADLVRGDDPREVRVDLEKLVSECRASIAPNGRRA